MKMMAGDVGQRPRRTTSIPSIPRHLHVQEHEIRLRLQDPFDRLGAMAGLAHDLDIGFGREQRAQAGARQPFVVHDQGADHEVLPAARLMRRSRPARAPACSTTGFAPGHAHPR